MKRNSTTFIEFLGWVCAAMAVLILLADIFIVALPDIWGFIPPDFLSIVGVVQAILLAAVFFWMAGVAKDLTAIRKALTGEPERVPPEEPPSSAS